MTVHIAPRGVALAVLATVMFALVSPYVRLLAPLSGIDIFAWRVLWTMPFTLLIVASRRQFGDVRSFAAEVASRPASALTLAACAGIMGVQQWIFLWAPLHGRIQQVSLGYFLLPIAMALVGRLVDRQRLHPLQWLAVALAVLGAAHEFAFNRAFSWPTLVVALGFPPYFLLRRRLHHDSLTVFTAELCVLLPVALGLAISSPSLPMMLHRADMWAYRMPVLGALSAVAFVTYLKASRMLPIALFGLLGYLEPILLVAISAWLFDEPLSRAELWTYGPIALSIVATSAYVAQRLASTGYPLQSPSP